jgi:hypothetical protein
MLKIEEASKELATKSYSEVQKDTAWKWASRAAASYLFMLEAEIQLKVGFWTVAEEFYHEAIEHAALTAEDPGDLVKKIREAVHPYQEKAADQLDDALSQDLR